MLLTSQLAAGRGQRAPGAWEKAREIKGGRGSKLYLECFVQCLAFSWCLFSAVTLESWSRKMLSSCFQPPKQRDFIVFPTLTADWENKICHSVNVCQARPLRMESETVYCGVEPFYWLPLVYSGKVFSSLDHVSHSVLFYFHIWENDRMSPPIFYLLYPERLRINRKDGVEGGQQLPSASFRLSVSFAFVFILLFLCACTNVTAY